MTVDEIIENRMKMLGAPKLPPEYEVEEMENGGWGIYCRNEHTITLHVGYEEAVSSAWASWLYDIGHDWVTFFLTKP